HDAVEADLLGQPVMREILVVEAAAGHRIEVPIAEHQRGGAEVETRLLVVGRHRLLGEVHEGHRIARQPSAMKRVTRRANASGRSISTKWPAPSTISSRACGSVFA